MHLLLIIPKFQCSNSEELQIVAHMVRLAHDCRQQVSHIRRMVNQSPMDLRPTFHFGFNSLLSILLLQNHRSKDGKLRYSQTFKISERSLHKDSEEQKGHRFLWKQFLYLC